ncbi:glycoside hydrolase family 2 protein [Puia dinghuensis]|uniref:Beta-mannosidase n=1 Tax=Puia dinghuensis TaxID=1792502 RepID=A0A8J2U5Z9_9BACT|nr:glycoside hydrolase family 2 TIM barrel-domain containing protein [Puia dinghuensis]GGA81400.1 beta-mannosidase [Puia dinghuensis]
MTNHRSLVLFLLALPSLLFAQSDYELNTGWKCQAIGKVHATGERLSQAGYSTRDWLDATVPGTVMTTLINNHLEPDPFYGLNNDKTPDIYTTGRDHYTYWFIKNFKETSGGQTWLDLRGVNYGCDIWLNGHKLNEQTHYGMYLRQSYNITKYLAPKSGDNRLAILVYPPDPVGNPNGGQGGDGEIARNVTHQYVAGWDWIQPIRDRNTGIWDKVTIHHTGVVRIRNPHIVTEVSGARLPDVLAKDQAPAVLRVSAELENTSTDTVTGTLQYMVDGEPTFALVKLAPGATKEIRLPYHIIMHPRLWWPNGYGTPELYHTTLSFADSDTIPLDFGVRELTTTWNPTTHSRELQINGQKIFIKGGNYIVSDELLRLSPERYDAEIRFHRDMNLNLIRVWGGALTERPEFYAACDRYGLLVFQDFWNSGDCNGRWEDPMKKEDQWTRKRYPDDHNLFIASAADQVKLLRNHPSLAFWCGGNEITPPEDIFHALKDSIIPTLDDTRTFFDYSNSDSMSFNNLGGNGDGPYGVQDIKTFWAKRTFPFNSEVGSVGMGDYESLQRFIPKEHLVAPVYHQKEDEVFNYHKYIGYDSSVYAYGPIKDLRDFAEKAQLVNYDQYRALMEGFSSHMWDWYTGVIIWKTQNPWTALRGQMYDYYLDPNACLYGLHSGSEPLHIMYDPVAGMTMIVNNTFRTHRDIMMQVQVLDMSGKSLMHSQQFFEVGPTVAKNYLPIGHLLDQLRSTEGVFLSLRLLDIHQQIVSDNFYWLPDSTGNYSGLRHMPPSALTIEASRAPQQPAAQNTPGAAATRITVTLKNPAGGPVAFFNRVSLIDPGTKQRLLPVFYSDNYVSVLPGESKTITLDYTPKPGVTPQVSVRGWNLAEKTYPIK